MGAAEKKTLREETWRRTDGLCVRGERERAKVYARFRVGQFRMSVICDTVFMQPSVCVCMYVCACMSVKVVQF